MVQQASDSEDEDFAKVDYVFEFFQKIGVECFYFHDHGIIPEDDTLRKADENLDKVVDKIEENVKSAGIMLLYQFALRLQHFLFAVERGIQLYPIPDAIGCTARCSGSSGVIVCVRCLSLSAMVAVTVLYSVSGCRSISMALC